MHLLLENEFEQILLYDGDHEQNMLDGSSLSTELENLLQPPTYNRLCPSPPVFSINEIVRTYHLATADLSCH